MPETSDTSASVWADQFLARHGREPAVLHVGNIANNAYLIARALNRAGIASDVLADNYYHIMGSPEWEEADFDATDLDQDLPDWSRVNLGSFARPRWFAQGPLSIAARYLRARRRNSEGALAAAWWKALAARRHLSCSVRLAPVRGWHQSRRAAAANRPSHTVSAHRAPLASSPLVSAFAELFPERDDRLSDDDIAEWAPRAAAVADLFRDYDIVHGYATEPILSMLAGRPPCVAFEHGTIRDIPFQPTTLGRLTALAYRLADEVVITNADNRVAAERLGLERYRFVPHPVNEDEPDASLVAGLRGRLRESLAADFIVFHPSRQHWDPRYRDPSLEKGNDIFIRGFAQFAHQRGIRAGAVLVEWGRTIEESRRLIAECGIADRVMWVAPQPRKPMSRYIAATEVVADQFFLGAFGSVTPQALHAGRPVLLKFDEAAHRWAFPDPPPILNASTPDAVTDHLARLFSVRSEGARLGEAGRAWYQHYHSMSAVTRSLIDVYRALYERSARRP